MIKGLLLLLLLVSFLPRFIIAPAVPRGRIVLSNMILLASLAVSAVNQKESNNKALSCFKQGNVPSEYFNEKDLKNIWMESFYVKKAIELLVALNH